MVFATLFVGKLSSPAKLTESVSQNCPNVITLCQRFQREAVMRANRQLAVIALVAAGLATASLLGTDKPDESATPTPSSSPTQAGSGPDGLAAGTPPADPEIASPPYSTNLLQAESPATAQQKAHQKGSRLLGNRQKLSPEDMKAHREQQKEQREALRAERRELAKNSPDVATARLAKRLRLTDEQTAALADINDEYAEQLRALDDFDGTEAERETALRQADTQRVQAILPIVQASPAVVEPVERFMARAAKAGAVPVSPNQAIPSAD